VAGSGAHGAVGVEGNWETKVRLRTLTATWRQHGTGKAAVTIYSLAGSSRAERDAC